MALYVESVKDNNFTDLYSVLIYGVIPRDIQLLALSLIFILLSKRTRRMLENVMGAEEQKNLLDKMMAITGNRAVTDTDSHVQPLRQTEYLVVFHEVRVHAEHQYG
jgi:hypothetical protein